MREPRRRDLWEEWLPVFCHVPLALLSPLRQGPQPLGGGTVFPGKSHPAAGRGPQARGGFSGGNLYSASS